MRDVASGGKPVKTKHPRLRIVVAPFLLAAGAIGPSGARGLSVTTKPVAAGDANCPHGGSEVDGQDGSKSYSCNGSSTTTKRLDEGDPHCPEGGEEVDDNEGHQSFACNGKH